MTVERVGRGEGGSGRQVPGRVGLAFAALSFGCLVVAPVLVLRALFGSWDLYGGPPTDAETAAAQRDAVLATVLATGCGGAAWLLAVRWGRGLTQVLFGTVAVVGLIGGLLVHGEVSPDLPGTPVRDVGPPVCQERSGGDNDCPGG